MIVASILLILVAVALLVAGLAGGSSPLLVTSIAASLLAAVALVVGARQAAATRAAADRTDRPSDPTGPGVPPYGPTPVEPEVPAQYDPSTVGTDDSGWRQPPESPVTDPAPTSPAAVGPFGGEPPAQSLSATETAQLVRIFADVRVVDGHPRFHLPDCPHLVGRDDDLLPVGEAVELGFTPCADCAPATTLLADPSRERSW